MSGVREGIPTKILYFEGKDKRPATLFFICDNFIKKDFKKAHPGTHELMWSTANYII